MTLERKAVGALLLDTALLIAAGIALLFGTGCGGTKRAPTHEELQSLEARVWRNGVLEPRMTARKDRHPPVVWRHDTGCLGSPYHFVSVLDGECIVGEYFAGGGRAETIHVAATNPIALCHEYAHAALWRDHKEIAPWTHHTDQGEHPLFAWVRSSCQDYMREQMDEMGVSL